MKKSLVKLAALTSAAFVLAGPVASVAVAEEANPVIVELTKKLFDYKEAANTAKQDALLTQGIKEAEDLEVVSVETADGTKWKLQVKAAESTPELDGYASEAEAIAAAEEALKKDDFNNSYSVSQGVDGRWYYVLSAVEDEKPAEPKPEERHITNIPFDTEEKARKAAEEYLKSDKNEVNKSYKIVKGADNKFYVELSTEAPETTEAPQPEAPVKKGYKTKEEAEAAAKKALENDPINKSFSVSQGADNLWYYVLSPVEVEKPADPKPETPEKDLDTVKKEALARLDLLKALTKAEVEHFTKAILNAKSANEVAAIIKEAEDVNFSVNLNPETPAKEVKPEEGKEGNKPADKKEAKKQELPETGEVSSFAIFGGAALSVLAGLGLVASKKEEN